MHGPNCATGLERGWLVFHPTNLGNLLTGFHQALSVSNCYFHSKTGPPGNEEVVFKWNRMPVAVRCPQCMSVVIPDPDVELGMQEADIADVEE